jgi:hypothetical protein
MRVVVWSSLTTAQWIDLATDIMVKRLEKSGFSPTQIATMNTELRDFLESGVADRAFITHVTLEIVKGVKCCVPGMMKVVEEVSAPCQLMICRHPCGDVNCVCCNPM